jgi:hypothetical protein
MSRREAIVEDEKHIFEYEFNSKELGPMKSGGFRDMYEVGKTYIFGVEFKPDIQPA